MAFFCGGGEGVGWTGWGEFDIKKTPRSGPYGTASRGLSVRHSLRDFLGCCEARANNHILSDGSGQSNSDLLGSGELESSALGKVRDCPRNSGRKRGNQTVAGRPLPAP